VTRALAHAHRPAPSKARPRRADAVENSSALHSALSTWSFSSVPVVQPKLKVGPSNDPLEHAADDVADRVVSGAAVEHAKTCGCGGTCPQCRAAAKLRRSARAATSVPDAGAGQVGTALRSTAAPLDAGVRSFFEPRLGADLSHVRVHTGPEAARSADALDARAYAVGRDVVFGAGEFRPESAAGRRLLAHELAHVLQQEDVGDRIQRDDKDKPARVDIAVVLDGSEVSMRSAQQLAPKVVRTYDIDDIKAAVTSAGGPIGTLYIVSHASPGQVQFESKIGTVSWKKLSEIGAALKNVLPADRAPQVVDFRGCQAGGATEELGKFRVAAGAGAARGSNCFTFDDVEGPVSIDDVEITSESQLNDQNRARFDSGLRRLIAQTKSPDGHSVKDCILGLGPGETADRSFDKIKARYFMGKGSITAEWASPEDDTKWQAGSRCYKDLTATSTPCKLTTTTAANEQAGAGGGASERAASAEPQQRTGAASTEEAAA
jgi:hypothetical protein